MTQKTVFRNIISHLRFPFSFFLLPIFLFGLIHSAPWSSSPWPLFFILHFLAYPSSNGYNSLQDRDTGSIGGIEKPSIVPSQMQWVSLLMDVLALGLTMILYSSSSTLLLLSYIIASRLYSNRSVRLKKYPIMGYLTVILFQGGVVFLLVNSAIGRASNFDLGMLLGTLISIVLIGSSYPLTQIYQHKQDAEDGVHTLSAKLGIRGTFVFAFFGTGLLFAVFSIYFMFVLNSWRWVLLFLLLTAPAASYMVSWAKRVWENPDHADFKHTMKMNIRGAIYMNVFFICWLIMKLNNLTLPI